MHSTLPPCTSYAPSVRPSRSSVAPVALLLLAAAWPSAALAAEEKGANGAPARRPNIVVILADDLGYGDLGCYGQKTLATPRIDAMAKEGLRFTQFYSGSTVCAPSRCTLLTGKHQGRALIRGNSSQPNALPPGELTVASLLKQHGYATACIGKWGVGAPESLNNPREVGFDYFFGYVSMWHAHNPYPEFLIRNAQPVPLRNEVAAEWKQFQDPKLIQAGKGVAAKRVDYGPDLLIDDALRYLRERDEQPFFLLLSLITPHANNEAGAKGMEVPDWGEFAARDWPEAEKGFAAVMQRLDRDVGRVLDVLRERKLAERTLVLLTSDNGPHKEGGHSVDFFDSNGKYRGQKRDLTEGGIRVPAIAWWPGVTPAGTENGLQWYGGDLLATCAELAGAPPPEGRDSDSFAAVLRGAIADEKDQWQRKSPLYWETYEGAGAQAVRFGKWKAVRTPIFTGPIELYDLSWDHAEKRSYSPRRADLLKHAANLLEKHHTPDPNWAVAPAKK